MAVTALNFCCFRRELASFLRQAPEFSFNPFSIQTEQGILPLSKESRYRITIKALFATVETAALLFIAFKATIILTVPLAVLAGIITLYVNAQYFKAKMHVDVTKKDPASLDVQLKKVPTEEQNEQFRKACWSRNNEEEALKLLQDHGCHGMTFEDNAYKNRCLSYACGHGYDRLVKAILKIAPKSIYHANPNYSSLLHLMLEINEPEKSSKILKF